MPFPRVAFAPVVAALLLAGCVARGPPPEDETPPVQDLPDQPPRAGPFPTSPPKKETGLPGLVGLGGTGTPAPPNPAPPAASTPAPPSPTAPSGGPSPTPSPPGPSPSAPSPSPTPPAAAPPSAGILPPPRFEAGDDAAPGRYVASFDLAPDGTSFAASLRGVPEARVHMDSLFRLVNDDAGGPREVRLAATREGAAQGVEEARVTLRDASGATLAVLDLLASSSNATFAIPPGSAVEGSWTFALGPGASPTLSWTIRLDA